jgi:hypothetical protein
MNDPLNDLENYKMSLNYHLAENESWQLSDDELELHYLHLELLENRYEDSINDQEYYY